MIPLPLIDATSSTTTDLPTPGVVDVGTDPAFTDVFTLMGPEAVIESEQFTTIFPLTRVEPPTLADPQIEASHEQSENVPIDKTTQHEDVSKQVLRDIEAQKHASHDPGIEIQQTVPESTKPADLSDPSVNKQTVALSADGKVTTQPFTGVQSMIEGKLFQFETTHKLAKIEVGATPSAKPDITSRPSMTLKPTAQIANATSKLQWTQASQIGTATSPPAQSLATIMKTPAMPTQAPIFLHYSQSSTTFSQYPVKKEQVALLPTSVEPATSRNVQQIHPTAETKSAASHHPSMAIPSFTQDMTNETIQSIRNTELPEGLQLTSSVGERAGIPAQTSTVAGMTHNAEVARQVANQMAAAAHAQPGRMTEIALNPEELGRVRMTMSATDTTITLSVLAERPETSDLLRRHIDALAEEFKALGFENISFSFQGEQQMGTENEAAEAPDFEGQAEAIEADLDALQQQHISTGLDLRL